MAAVLDLSALTKRHKAVAGASFSVASGAEAGDVAHLHEPVHDFVQCTVVADIELFGAFVFRFRLIVAAHTCAGSAADLGDAQVQGTLAAFPSLAGGDDHAGVRDRKSTRLNSSHVSISYAVFCLT